jgi:hypothetical protein
MTCVVYTHTQTTEDSASGVNRAAVRNAARGVGLGLSLLNYICEVLGSKMLTGSPAIPMSFSSFNDLLHLKLGHGSFHPRLNTLNTELNPICHLLALLGAHHIFHVSMIRTNHFTIHWHPHF